MSRARRSGILTMALAVLTPGPVAVFAGDAVAPLRVMSFNIRINVPVDGQNAWPLRKEKAASMIRFHRADLVGLQEPLPGQLDDLESLLGGFSWFGVGREVNGGGELNAILYRKDRLEVMEHRTFWLSDTPSAPGSRGWDAAMPRIVTWGRLRDLRTGVVFHHFNTHFDYRGVVARRESARLIVTKIGEIVGGATPVILTGDFNSIAEDEPHRILTAQPATGPGEALVDAMAISREPHHGPTSSWNGFRAITPARRIDFIFVSPQIDVVSHGILSDTFDGRFPSDHLPVLAEVTMRPR